MARGKPRQFSRQEDQPEEDWEGFGPLEELDPKEAVRKTGALVEHPYDIASLRETSGIGPSKQAQTIMRTFFEVRPTVDNHRQAISEVGKRLGLSYSRTLGIVQKAMLHAEAKKQRRDYADKIYEEKIPLARSIVGKSLASLDHFLTSFKPTNIEDAKGLSKVATEVSTLLRLELGQSTQQIELIHKTQKSVTVLMEEIKNADPFMDYAEVVPEPEAPPSE